MFKKVALPNGLRILTAPMQGTNTVTTFVMCGTGSDHETEAQSGISHFLEHMFFKGTEKRPNHLAITKELDRMGSASNAFTWHETTGYFVKAGAIHFDRALDLLADIYRNSRFPEEEMEKEKRVIIEELHMRREIPTSYIWRLWEKVLYGASPAGREVGGTEETVQAVGRPDLVKYFESRYVAPNTAVVIAGKIDEDAAVRRVIELFADIRAGEPHPAPAFKPEQSGPILLPESRPIDQTHVVAGFRGYDAFHPRRWAADMLAIVLGGSWSSRMFVRVREELGLAYTVSSSGSFYTNRGSFETYAGVSHGNLVKAIEAILEEYRRIREEAVSDEELADARDFLKGRMLMEWETSEAVADHAAGEEMLTGDPLTIEEVFARIDAVKPSDLAAVAQDLFQKNRLNVAILGPEPTFGDPEALINRFA